MGNPEYGRGGAPRRHGLPSARAQPGRAFPVGSPGGVLQWVGPPHSTVGVRRKDGACRLVRAEVIDEAASHERGGVDVLVETNDLPDVLLGLADVRDTVFTRHTVLAGVVGGQSEFQGSSKTVQEITKVA